VSLASAAQYAVFLGVVILLVKPVGGYLYRVFSHQKTLLDPLLEPVERLLHRAAGVDVTHELSGVEYALAFVLFCALLCSLASPERCCSTPSCGYRRSCREPSPSSPELGSLGVIHDENPTRLGNGPLSAYSETW